MFLYLFSLWFLSIFTTAHRAESGSIELPRACQTANSVNSENSDPFYCQEKNVLFATEDAGNTWKDFTGNLPSTSTPSCFWVTQKEWLVGAAEGLYIGKQGMSMDSSRSAVGLSSPKWKQDELVPRDVTFFVEGNQGIYLVSHGEGIYQNQSGAGKWTKISSRVNNRPFFTLAESSKGALLGGFENGIYRSDDHGKSWKQVYENVGVNMINEYNGALYACSWRGLLSSTDDGKHWDVVLPGNTSVFRTRVVNSGLVAIIAGQEFQGVWGSNEVKISTDKGKSWKPMFGSVPKEFKNVYDIVEVGNIYFAATNTGIFKSGDGGVTWVKTVAIPQDKGTNFRLVVEGNTLFVLQAPGC